MDEEKQTMFVLVTCLEDRANEVLKQLQKIRDIDEINPTDGPYDFILKIKPKTSSESRHILNQKIRSLDSIRHTLTLRAIE